MPSLSDRPPPKAPENSPPPPSARLHGEPGGQVDRVLNFLSYVAKSRALSLLLDEAPVKIASCVDAEVASLYLLEGDGRTLVMRGNVGFPQRACGTVRLAVGEGITGMAVESAYPISAAWAPEHEHYRAFPELDEDRYPAFLAVPIIGNGGPLGCVVVQREQERPFSDAEVSLVAALTAPISSAIRLARLLDDLRDKSARRTGSGTRKVTLPGVPVVPGRALGAVAALRRPATKPSGSSSSLAREMFPAAIELVEESLRDLIKRAKTREMSDRTDFLNSYLLMLRDQRFRQETIGLLDEGHSLAEALGQVARHSSRAANQSGDQFLIERARDLEQLCDALVMIASPDERATLPSKAIIVADQLSIYDALISARTHPTGFALTEPAPKKRTKVLLQLMGVPAITDVAGAFRWIGPGDIALLDADHGFLIVNPSRSEVSAYRSERRQRTRPPC